MTFLQPPVLTVPAWGRLEEAKKIMREHAPYWAQVYWDLTGHRLVARTDSLRPVDGCITIDCMAVPAGEPVSKR